MLVKCPVCQTEYELEPGKYECKCGATFFVDGSGATAEASETSAIEGSDETSAPGHRSEFADAVEGQNAKGANRKSGKGMWFALAGVIIVLAVIGIGYGCHQSAKAQRIAEEQRIAAERQQKAEEQRIAEEKRQRDLRIKAEQQAKREAESAAARNSASKSNPDKNKTSTQKTAEQEQGMQNHGQYHADIQGLLKVDNLLKKRLVMKQSQRKTFDKTYSVPFIVRAVCRTDGIALRFCLLGGEIWLKWEKKGYYNLNIDVLGLKKGIKFSEKNGWSTVEIKVTASELSVYMDGKLRYTGKGNFENKKSLIGLRTHRVGNNKSTVSVDQLSVLTPVSSQTRVPVSQPRGAAQPASELNPDKNMTGSQNQNSSAAQTKEITLQGKKVLWLPGKYTPPYVIRAKCKTNKYNLKFHFLNSQIIFNWERDPHELRVDIPGISPRHAKGQGYVGINTWADFMVNVLPNQISIYVDGDLRYTGTGDFQNKESAVGIATNKGGGRNIVTVKNFSVLTPGSSQPQGAAQPESESNPDKNMTSTPKTAEPGQGMQNQGQYHADQGLFKVDNLLKGKLVMKHGQRKTFNKTYSVPFIVRAVCRTDGVALRFKLLGGEISFKWMKGVYHLGINNVLGLKKGISFKGKNGWSTFEFKVTASEFSVYVDGKLQYTGKGNFENNKSRIDLVTLGVGNDKSTASVDQLSVLTPVSSVEFKSISLPNNVKLEMVKIKAGSFIMGSPGSESGKDSKEKQHRVTLTRGYWLGKYEVTQRQWKAVMETNPSSNKEGDNYPVEQVSWHDAKKFCAELNKRYADKLPQGYRFDLPTEAQWEYACRAGTISLLNNAKDVTSETGVCPNLNAVGWYRENSSRTTHDYGRKRPNTWGLYDMHGNVWEWCSDWHGTYSGDATDPTGPSNGSKRIIRGGSWRCPAGDCTSARRGFLPPYYRDSDIGFRLAIVPVQPAPSSHKNAVKPAK